jgi:hypothetical protein
VKPRGPAAKLSLIALCAALAACGGSEFSARDPGGDPDGGGSGGGSGVGGVSGGGAGGAGGSGGSGGATGGGAGSDAGPDANGCTPDSCGGGQYCNGDTLRCADCRDVARFRFTPPERLEAVSSSSAGNQRFPRLALDGSELLFRTGSEGEFTALWFTLNPTEGGNEQTLDLDIDMPDQAESGPLPVVIRPGNGEDLNFFFDRTTFGPGSPRELYGADRNGRGGNVVRLPPPINTAPDISNYSIALAPATQRGWWMRGSGELAQVMTFSLQGGAAEIVLLTAGVCPRIGADATPWVPADGSFMLFRSNELDNNCGTLGEINDLWVAVLAENGQVAGEGFPLDDLNRAGWDDTDPSMSSDLCWLYFASDGGPDNHEFDVYRARRR